MPNSRWSTQNKHRGMLEVFCLIMYLEIFFNLTGPLHIPNDFQFCAFMGVLCVCMCVSASFSFSLPMFSLVCFWFCPVPVCFIGWFLLYFSLDVYLFSMTRQIGCGFRWEGSWEGSGRSSGR